LTRVDHCKVYSKCKRDHFGISRSIGFYYKSQGNQHNAHLKFELKGVIPEHVILTFVRTDSYAGVALSKISREVATTAWILGHFAHNPQDQLAQLGKFVSHLHRAHEAFLKYIFAQMPAASAGTPLAPAGVKNIRLQRCNFGANWLRHGMWSFCWNLAQHRS